jgi:hypothetical protein
MLDADTADPEVHALFLRGVPKTGSTRARTLDFLAVRFGIGLPEVLAVDAAGLGEELEREAVSGLDAQVRVVAEGENGASPCRRLRACPCASSSCIRILLRRLLFLDVALPPPGWHRQSGRTSAESRHP